MNEYKMNDEEIRKRRYLRQIYFGEAMLASGDTGLKFERGIWTPDADIADTYIYFNEQHDDAPFFYCIYDASDTYSDVLNTNYVAEFFSYYLIDGIQLRTPSNLVYGGMTTYVYRGSSATSYSGNYLNVQTSNITNYLTSEKIRASTNSSARYWRAGVEYRWLAVWAPEE